MPTTITSQNAAEIGSNLTNLGIWSYGVGGKVKTAYQNFYEACMATLGNVNMTGSVGRPRARQVGGVTGAGRTRAARGTTTPATATTTPPARRRGRPPGSTTSRTRTPRVRNPATGMNPQTEAILKCVAAGYTTQTAMVPELKRTYGITIRPNHLGIQLGRLFRAERLAKTGTGKTATWALTAIGQQMAQAA